MTPPPPLQQFPVELRVFADYNSFELTDSAATDRFDSADWIDDWVERLIRDRSPPGTGSSASAPRAG
jgi:hypothetical protein